MNCDDGIHAHFKVVNNDFIDICGRVNIRPINGIISDNIINDTILRVQNPFYLEFDHIPIYPVSMKPLHMGIHIQGYSKTQKKHHNTYNKTYNDYFSQNCVLGTSKSKTNCFIINSDDDNILPYRNTYYSPHFDGVSTFVNWTLYYSNEYETMSYFKDNIYMRTEKQLTTGGLNFLNIIGGPYPMKSSSSVNHEWKYQPGYGNRYVPVTHYYCYLYDIIFIKNIIVSITIDNNIEGFQEYITGSYVPAIVTETPTIKAIENSNYPAINPITNDEVTPSPTATFKEAKSFYNVDNIYQNLFYALAGLIVGILLAVLYGVCKNKKTRQKRNNISQKKLLSKDDNIISINN